MEQQIANILAQTVTKTRKIEQLLMLGLTRRQVADLVTNGNYGFVQNVYARMQNTLSPTSSVVSFPELDYSFTRRFGVELEAYNCDKNVLARALQEEGINVRTESYNHNSRPHWKIVTDSSLRGNQTFELVSPILEGEAGLKELKKVCWVLDACGAKVNVTCGTHVHFDASAFNMDTWKNVALTYKNIENIIDKFLPESRTNGHYCKSLSRITASLIQSVDSITALQQQVFRSDRYFKVNVQSYSRHRTVEFRQHSGTVSFEKLSNWIYFLNGLVTFAQHGSLASGTQLNEIPFLDDELKTYFRQRTKKLNR